VSRKRIPFEARYWNSVIPIPFSGCLIWLGHIEDNGYAKVKIGYQADGDRRTEWVHRAAYEHFVGPIPEGYDLDHLCRIRCCVELTHLEPVTRLENIQRGTGPELLRARTALMSRDWHGRFVGAGTAITR
jgi:hypothetical protein